MIGLCVSLLSVALGAEPRVASAFTVHSAATDPIVGRVRQIDKDWSVTVTVNEKPVTVPDLISLRRTDRPLPAYPAGPQIIFANGDRLPGEVLSIENDRVRFRATFGEAGRGEQAPELLIPLAALAEVWFQAPPESDSARHWAGERRRRDVVLLNNGDTRTGSVAGMSSNKEALVIKEGSRETRIETVQVNAIVLNTELARTPRPKGPYARLVLADGGRLSLRSAEADDRTLTGRALFQFDSEIKIPLAQVVALDVRQGKAVYLSDLKPRKYEHTPFLGVKWNYENDLSVAGRELRLAGGTYDKGIGMHSESRLSYSLNGEYRRFEALAGLDNRTGQGGSVRLRVLVDGQEKDANEKEVTAATGPRAYRLDITGAKELALVVEFGSGGDVCDHVDWIDARVVK
jgi:hypothetical protein